MGVIANPFTHCIAVSAMFISAPALAYGQSRPFNVPALPAARGIQQIAKQANVQVLMRSEIVQGRRTNSVQQIATIGEAFDLLLKGTGLKALSDDGRTFTIVPQQSAQGSAAPRMTTGGHGAAAIPAGTGVSQGAPAPRQERPAMGLGEIVVTAQKRAQNIQDIGVSVTAMGREDLAMVGRQDIRSIATKVPSLQVQQYAATITVFNIRGVAQNDVADSQEAPIAFYNDEVYVGALGAISGQNFDLGGLIVLGVSAVGLNVLAIAAFALRWSRPGIDNVES